MQLIKKIKAERRRKNFIKGKLAQLEDNSLLDRMKRA